MALSVRTNATLKAARKVQPARAAVRAVRPVAALNANVAGVAVAAAAATTLAVAPAQAAEVVATLASAASGYPFVPPEWAPSVLVPFTGLFLPAVAMATLFVYIEKEA